MVTVPFILRRKLFRPIELTEAVTNSYFVYEELLRLFWLDLLSTKLGNNILTLVLSTD